MESRACITLILVLMLVEGSTGGDWESALWHQYFNAKSYTQLAKRLSIYVVFLSGKLILTDTLSAVSKPLLFFYESI